MIFKSTILASASGSVGGMTFSHNRGGAYTRARAIPSNPSSVAQQSVRAIQTSLVAAWGALTNAQRVAWNEYAAANPQTNALGDKHNAGGIGMFIRANFVRNLVGLTNITAAPTVNTPVVLTPPTLSADTPGTSAIQVAYTNTDEWATATGGALAIFIARPQAPTIFGFKGPFRYTDKVLGAATPPTSPKSVTSPFPFAAGQKLFARFIAVSADGRVSGQELAFRTA